MPMDSLGPNTTMLMCLEFVSALRPVSVSGEFKNLAWLTREGDGVGVIDDVAWTCHLSVLVGSGSS